MTNDTTGSGELTPADCLRRLPEPTLDIDEHDNPLDDRHHVELRRSILAIAELDHVSEITLVLALVASRRRPGGVR
jgi:hypothetical protein